MTGRCRFFALAGALLLAGASAAAQTPPAPAAPQPVQIEHNAVLVLIRSTLLALDQANKTGNYTVLRDLGAPGFQAANSAAKLAEIFADQRVRNFDLSGTLVAEPQITLAPQAAANGMMRMAGFFPAGQTRLTFELVFAPVDNRWRLFGLAVNVAAPAAPAPPPAAKPEDKKPEDKKPPEAKAAPEPRKPSTKPAAARRVPATQPTDISPKANGD